MSLQEILQLEHKVDPDSLLKSIYTRIKKNQMLWCEKTQVGKEQVCFISVLTTAIRGLGGVELKKATGNQLLSFLHTLTGKNKIDAFGLIKYVEKAHDYEKWKIYKGKFCADWIELMSYFATTLTVFLATSRDYITKIGKTIDAVSANMKYSEVEIIMEIESEVEQAPANKTIK